MLVTYTMYKAGHEPVSSVYPVDLPAWLADGWTPDPIDVESVEVVDDQPEAKPAKKKATPEA